jgi:hypothetical protein
VPRIKYLFEIKINYPTKGRRGREGEEDNVFCLFLFLVPPSLSPYFPFLNAL